MTHIYASVCLNAVLSDIALFVLHFTRKHLPDILLYLSNVLMVSRNALKIGILRARLKQPFLEP